MALPVRKRSGPRKPAKTPSRTAAFREVARAIVLPVAFGAVDGEARWRAGRHGGRAAPAGRALSERDHPPRLVHRAPHRLRGGAAAARVPRRARSAHRAAPGERPRPRAPPRSACASCSWSRPTRRTRAGISSWSGNGSRTAKRGLWRRSPPPTRPARTRPWRPSGCGRSRRSMSSQTTGYFTVIQL